MPIDPQLLEMLACPLCKEKIMITEDGQGLRCPVCRRVFPIEDDIPIMLLEKARIEGESS